MSPEDRISNALAIVADGVDDGDHHKMWIIDQMVRALTGCPMVTRTSRDYRGNEYTYETQGESEEYRRFVAAYEADWDEGIAP